MIAMIEALLANSPPTRPTAIYFDVRSFPSYGALSGNTLAELEAGASGRVEERSDKRHQPTLWKRDPKHLMQWDSPFGRGFRAGTSSARRCRASTWATRSTSTPAVPTTSSRTTSARSHK